MSQGMFSARIVESEAREASALISDTAQALFAREDDRSSMWAKSSRLFVKLYFSQTPLEDIGRRIPTDLADMIAAHLETGRRRTEGEIAIQVRRTANRRATIDIVVDDRPFLLDSVLDQLQTHDAHIRFVVHPVLDIMRDSVGEFESELSDRAEHDAGQQAGPVGIEERLQGPADPVVVEHREIIAAEPEQGRVEPGGPLTQTVERFPAQHQVRDHHPDRDRRGQLQAGIIIWQGLGQQRR